MASTASASGGVSPILECVWHVNATSWLALWGYSNTTGSTQSIPVGSTNGFSPVAQNQGQPTSFQTGTVDDILSVPFDARDKLTWSLGGSSGSASTSDKQCSSDPVPIVAGTNGSFAVLPLAFVALGILVVGLGCWRFAPNLLALRRPDSR